MGFIREFIFMRHLAAIERSTIIHINRKNQYIIIIPLHIVCASMSQIIIIINGARGSLPPLTSAYARRLTSHCSTYTAVPPATASRVSSSASKAESVVVSRSSAYHAWAGGAPGSADVGVGCRWSSECAGAATSGVDSVGAAVTELTATRSHKHVSECQQKGSGSAERTCTYSRVAVPEGCPG